MFGIIARWIDKKVEEKYNQKLKDYSDNLKEVQKKGKYTIVEAFIIGGVQYFQFEDSNNIPFQRAYAALDFYQEMKSKTSAEYLKEHCEASKKVFKAAIESLRIKSGTIDLDVVFKYIQSAQKMNNNLMEKTKFVVSPEVVYKLASVLYFDATEDPTKFDYNHAHNKISKWKEHDMDSFFLNTPVKELIPYTDISKEDLNTYINTASLVEDSHQNHLLQVLGKAKKQG